MVILAPVISGTRADHAAPTDATLSLAAPVDATYPAAAPVDAFYPSAAPVDAFYPAAYTSKPNNQPITRRWFCIYISSYRRISLVMNWGSGDYQLIETRQCLYACVYRWYDTRNALPWAFWNIMIGIFSDILCSGLARRCKCIYLDADIDCRLCVCVRGGGCTTTHGDSIRYVG